MLKKCLYVGSILVLTISICLYLLNDKEIHFKNKAIQKVDSSQLFKKTNDDELKKLSDDAVRLKTDEELQSKKVAMPDDMKKLYYELALINNDIQQDKLDLDKKVKSDLNKFKDVDSSITNIDQLISQINKIENIEQKEIISLIDKSLKQKSNYKELGEKKSKVLKELAKLSETVSKDELEKGYSNE